MSLTLLFSQNSWHCNKEEKIVQGFQPLQRVVYIDGVELYYVKVQEKRKQGKKYILPWEMYFRKKGLQPLFGFLGI